MEEPKTSELTSETGLLNPQPHGGALRIGGKPGNAGGTGRPPDRIREWYREIISTKGVEFAEALFEREGVSDADILRFMDMGNKMGWGELKPMIPQEFIDGLAAVLFELSISEEVALPILKALEAKLKAG